MKDVDSLANTTTHLGREMADSLVGCYCKPINTSQDLIIHFCYCALKGIMVFFLEWAELLPKLDRISNINLAIKCQKCSDQSLGTLLRSA